MADQHKANRYTVVRLGWTIIYKIIGHHPSASKLGVVRGDYEQLSGFSALVTYRGAPLEPGSLRDLRGSGTGQGAVVIS